jgi:hypothetical protein
VVKIVVDLAVHERPSVSETSNTHEVWRSSDSEVKAMMMSLPCKVVRVAEQELVEFEQPTAADPSIARLLVAFETTLTVMLIETWMAPLVPVTITEYRPSVVAFVVVTVRVSVAIPPFVIATVLKPKLRTREIRDDVAARFIVPLNPSMLVIVRVDWADEPRVRVRLLGLAERVKVGTGLGSTVRGMLILWVRVPFVPLMVRSYVPRLLVRRVETLTVKEAVWFARRNTKLLLRVTFGPIGEIESVSVTFPEKLLMLVTESVVELENPNASTRLGGFAVNAKSGRVLLVNVADCTVSGTDEPEPFAMVTQVLATLVCEHPVWNPIEVPDVTPVTL